MTDLKLEIARLTQRVSALEKANRRWKLCGLFLFIIFAVAASLTGYRAYAQLSAPAMPKTVRDVVTAHEFILMGSHGEMRGRIGVLDGEPALRFYDSTGRLWWYAPPKLGVVQ